MKHLFIEAKRKGLSLSQEALSFIKNHKDFSILYSIQYKKLAEQFKKEAEKHGKKILAFSQVLGCSSPKAKGTIVLIGSGRFHAVNIASRINLPIYIIEGHSITEITKKEIENLKTRKKAVYLKFLHAEEVGIIVSTKPGQSRINLALNLKRKLEKQGKKAYLFITNNINPSELDNFPLPIYINTACPGLFFDSNKIINIEDLSNY